MLDSYAPHLLHDPLLRPRSLLLRRRGNSHLRLRDARGRDRRYVQLHLHLRAVPLLAPSASAVEDAFPSHQKLSEA